MNLYSSNSRGAIVNLLSDYILNKISTNELSIISVVDCINFIVVKGKTTSEEVLNLQEIVEELKQRFQHIFNEEKMLTHIIDLIEYKSDLEEVTSITYSYYNSENCLYNNSQIENYKKESSKNFDDNYVSQEIKDSLVVYSKFPFGYSLGMGRELFLLGKHIIYNIPPNYPFYELTLTIDKESEKLEVFDESDKEYVPFLKSAILDCINMDSTWIKSEIKKVEWYYESTNPLSDFEFLKVKNKDFIII